MPRDAARKALKVSAFTGAQLVELSESSIAAASGEFGDGDSYTFSEKTSPLSGMQV